MSTKISKDELREPDAFLKSMETGLSFLEKYAKAIAAIVAIAIVGTLIYSLMGYLERRKENHAQEAFYTVDAKYAKLKEGFEKVKMQAIIPDVAGKDKKSEGTPASGDVQKDYGSVITDLQTVQTSNPGTKAAAQAGLDLAEIYMSYKQPEKAAEAVSLSARALSHDELMGGLSYMMWGNALAAKGDCTQAIEMWQKVISVKTVSYLHPDATLRTGICYENLKQNDKAIEMYKRASQEFADSSAGQTAKTLLRALEMKNKTPGAAGEQHG